jgi:hypothetical protein
MAAQHGSTSEHTTLATRQRISACRKRLRRARAIAKALRLEQDEAVQEAARLLESISGVGDCADSENEFEEAGASKLAQTRRFSPEVDRRTRLRAR